MASDQQRQKTGARQIDWSRAEISDGTLMVELMGAAARGWSKDFGRVLALLEQSSHAWDRVALKGSTIRVAGVQQGSEEELRHFLESVVLQVNSDLHLREEHRDAGEHDGAEADSRDRQATERRMAATFRGFADAAKS